jgi:hypothetical protein
MRQKGMWMEHPGSLSLVVTRNLYGSALFASEDPVGWLASVLLEFIDAAGGGVSMHLINVGRFLGVYILYCYIFQYIN